MDNESPDELGMTSPARYKIRVKGKLDAFWADWFNGTNIQFEDCPGGKSCTTLACLVRDQAELLGILNRLNSLNLPLLRVIYTKKEVDIN